MAKSYFYVNVLILFYLASTCNSTIIEIYVDMIRVSHVFDSCQMLEYIAGSTAGDKGAGIDDITNILRTLIFTALLVSGFVALRLTGNFPLRFSAQSSSSTYLDQIF